MVSVVYVNDRNVEAYLHGIFCAMAEHMRRTIRIGVLVKTIYSERTTRLPSTGCLFKVPRKSRLDDSGKREAIDVLAGHLRHAGFVCINRFSFARDTIWEEMRRRGNETGRRATEGTTLDRARRDHIG